MRFFFILNKDFISYVLKKQAVISLLSIEAEYITLSLATWEAILWELLLTELELLTFFKQFAKIHVYNNNKCAKAIFSSFMQDKSIPKQIQSLFPSIQNKSILEEIPIMVKKDNQNLISLANNSILHKQIKHINI